MWRLNRNDWEMYKVSVPFCPLNLLLFWCSRWRRPPVAKTKTRTAKILKNSGGFRLAKKATTLHAAAQFLVHLFAITTRLRQKFPMYTYEGEFLFLIFFFNSTAREFAYICESERVGIIARNSAEVSKDEKSLFEWRFAAVTFLEFLPLWYRMYREQLNTWPMIVKTNVRQSGERILSRTKILLYGGGFDASPE